MGLCEPLGSGFREGGRGIGNIRMRVAQMGAEVAFYAGHPGTCVTFSFPVALKAADGRPDKQG